MQLCCISINGNMQCFPTQFTLCYNKNTFLFQHDDCEITLARIEGWVGSIHCLTCIRQYWYMYYIQQQKKP